MEDPPNLGGEFWQRSTKTPGSSAQQQGGTPAGHGTLPYGVSHVSGPGSRQAKSNLKAWACVPQVVTTHPVHCTEYLFLCFGLRGLSLSQEWLQILALPRRGGELHSSVLGRQDVEEAAQQNT